MGGADFCSVPSAAPPTPRFERLAGASGVTAACTAAAALERLTGRVAVRTTPSAAPSPLRLERCTRAEAGSGSACGAKAGSSGAAASCLLCSAGACSGVGALGLLKAARAERLGACSGSGAGTEPGAACGGGSECATSPALRLERCAGACPGAEALGLFTAASAERRRACGADPGATPSACALERCLRLGTESGTAAGDVPTPVRASDAGVAALGCLPMGAAAAASASARASVCDMTAASSEALLARRADCSGIGDRESLGALRARCDRLKSS